MLEPPCASFSPADWPAVRSYSCPLGFDRAEKKTLSGNVIALNCLLLFSIAVRHAVPALLEQPRSSRMRWLPVWRWLLSFAGVQESWLASCAYGCRHRKEFALLAFGVDLGLIHRKCPGNHQHTKIQGQYTRCSAVYHPRVASAFARVLARAILDKPPPEQPRKVGLESVAVNDVLISGQWRTVSCWAWGLRAHINVLETTAALRVFEKVARLGGDCKLNLLLDSSVARGAIAKGRSSSKLLRPVLLKIGAVTIAAGIFPGLHHAPTRLNTADDPTRDRPVRAPADCSVLALCPREEVFRLTGCCKLSSASSGWLRLALLLSFRFSKAQGVDLLRVLGQPFRILFPPKVAPSPPDTHVSDASHGPGKFFDASKGYPGEGPVAPRNSKDRDRQAARVAQVLPEGRPVLERARQNRSALLALLKAWIEEKGADWETFCRAPAEDVSKWLAAYGARTL